MGRARNNLAAVAVVDGFTAVFGRGRGLGAGQERKIQSEHELVISKLTEHAFADSDKRMGAVADVLRLGSQASRVVKHQGVLHLWPDGDRTWISPWGEPIIFACGLSASVRPQQRVFTHMWTRAHAQPDNFLPRCSRCQMSETQFPEMLTRDGEIDDSLDLYLPPTAITDIKHTCMRGLDAAIGGDLTESYLQNQKTQNLAISSLAQAFVAMAAPQTYAQREYGVGQVVTPTWMRANRSRLDDLFPLTWWEITTADLLISSFELKHGERLRPLYWRKFTAKGARLPKNLALRASRGR